MDLINFKQRFQISQGQLVWVLASLFRCPAKMITNKQLSTDDLSILDGDGDRVLGGHHTTYIPHNNILTLQEHSLLGEAFSLASEVSSPLHCSQ